MKRRHFLATSLAATAVNAATSSERRLGIAQWGSQHSHADGKLAAARKLPEVWDVCGYFSTELKAADRPPYQGLKAYADKAALLADPKVQVVIIETAMEDSCAAAMEAIQAGKHVHLDKPGSLDHASFRAMREAAEKSGLTVQLGYMLRVNPAFVFLKTLIQEGALGKVTEIDASMGKEASEAQRKTLLALPGHGMFELGCHLVDMVVHLLGKPSKVTAIGKKLGQDELLDNQLAVLEYPTATATLRVNHTDPLGGPRRFFQVAGTNGFIRIEPLEKGILKINLHRDLAGQTKGMRDLSLQVSADRYQAEFSLLAAKLARPETVFPWDAAHDIAVHETALRAAGVAIPS